MKKPKTYKEKFNRIKTQNLYWEFVNLLENKLRNDFNLLKVNIPSFSKINNFIKESSFKEEFGRKITFDSINDYEIYSLLTSKKFELFEILLSLFDFNDFLTSRYLGLFTEINKIERDKEVENILEVETKNFEILISVDIKEKIDAKIITFDFYSIIFDFLNNVVNKNDDDFYKLSLPTDIKIFYEEKEMYKWLNFSKEEIKKNLLQKNGIILWQEKNKTKYELLVLSSVTNEIKTFFTIERLEKNMYGRLLKNKTEKLKERLETNKYFFISLNIDEIMFVLLEKFSTKELFSLF